MDHSQNCIPQEGKHHKCKVQRSGCKVLTFAPCTYGVSLLSTGATIPLAQVVVVTSCNLRWRCFILQPLAQIVHLHLWWFTLCNLRWWYFFIYPLAQILHLHSGNLHCVVVYIYIHTLFTAKYTQRETRKAVIRQG